MAEGGRPKDNDDKEYKLRHTRELLHGRLQDDEVQALLEMKEWDEQAAVALFFSTEPKDLRELLGTHRSEAELITIQMDDVLKDLAMKDKIEPVTRQFTCEPCNQVWWRKVPARKQVSQCKKCKKKYEPVPKEHEFGWAIFECQCGRQFSGYGQMNQTGSECYTSQDGCGTICYPARINPPTYRRRKKSRSAHSCDAPDCASRCNHGGGGRRRGPPNQPNQPNQQNQPNQMNHQNQQNQPNQPNQQNQPNQPVVLYQRNQQNQPNQQNHNAGDQVEPHCAHPTAAHKKKVLYRCPTHTSTGSSVATFLSQDCRSFVSDLDTVHEGSH